jgi:hypothetical protein
MGQSQEKKIEKEFDCCTTEVHNTTCAHVVKLTFFI